MSRGAAVAFLTLAAAGCREPEQIVSEPAKKESAPTDSGTSAKSAEPIASLAPVAAYGAPAPMPSITTSASASTSASTPPRPPPTTPTPSMKPAYGGPPKVKVPAPLYGGPPF